MSNNHAPHQTPHHHPQQQQQQAYPLGYPAGDPWLASAPPTQPSANTQQYSPQYPHPQWPHQYGAQAYQTMPSPYIPRQPATNSHDRSLPLHRTNSQTGAPRRKDESSRSRSMSLVRRPERQGELSPLFDNPDTRPTIRTFGPYDMHTPSSTLSYATTTSSRLPSDLYTERPSNWRRDFKFKSGLAGVFRLKSSHTYPPSDWAGSGRLALHQFLQHDRANPPTIHDLRRDPYSLVFRKLSHRPEPRDMAAPATDPPTTWMRLYHSRFPWYIDILTGGDRYITLGDFFLQLAAALDRQIARSDYYNDDLDEHDRQTLTQAYLARCRDETERMGGVRRVDFLRGKVFFEGLTRGKNGMWRLRSGRDKT